MQLPDEEVSYQRRRQWSSLAHLSIIAALVLAAFVPLLPTAAEEGVGPGFPPPEKEAGKHETGKGPECKGTACKDQSDPNDSPKGSRDTLPGPLSNWYLELYLEPRDLFGNPYWINPSSDDPSGNRYPVQVTIDDGVSRTTVTTWCNWGSVGWCDRIGPFSGLPLTVTIDPPGLLTDSWRVISGPGTYDSNYLQQCGNPCQIPIVLQLEDLAIYLRTFWYGPALPSTGATYTLRTGLGTFTLTCPAGAHAEYCLPYPLVLEDWIDFVDRSITLNEDTLPADWVAVAEYGLGTWDGSAPPTRGGYCYYDFGPDDRWTLCGNALYIETVNLNTRDPQPPAGEFFVLEFRKAWIGPSLPTSGATIQVTFWPEGHWLHQTRTFTCPGSAPSEVCFQMNFPGPAENSDFADFVMSITEVGGPPGWTPGGAFGSYDLLGLVRLLGCPSLDECDDLPPACREPSKEDPVQVPICTIVLTNMLNASGGGGGSSGDDGGGGSSGGGSGSSSGGGGGTSSDGTQAHDPAAQNLEYADQTTGQERLTDTRASNQSVPQVLPRTGRQWSPAWWIALLAAALPVAAGLALRPSRLRQRR